MSIFNKIKSSTYIKINCFLTIFIALLLIAIYFYTNKKIVITADTQELNLCCAFPCKNGGICISEDKGYACDCSDTGYFGKNCQKITPLHWIKSWFKFNPTSTCFYLIDSFPSIQKIINSLPLVQHILVKNLYMTAIHWGSANYRWAIGLDLLSTDVFINSSLSTRSLPPVPKRCPTPTGIRGPSQLPSPELIYENLLKRSEFQPCSKGTNLLFSTYMQHFTSQFHTYEVPEVKEHDWKISIIDMSHIYGKDETSRQALRSFDVGKLKTRFFKGEEYPPYVSDCPGIKMIYPRMNSKTIMSNLLSHDKSIPQWALGNAGLSMTPMLFVLATIWIREHNRVCTILANQHKHWNDEQLHQTAKLIVTGEVIKITATEVVRHLIQSGTEIPYKPEILQDFNLQYAASVPEEYSVLLPWYSTLPEKIIVESESYNMSQLLFTNNNIVFEHGIDSIINAMVITATGEVTKNNILIPFKSPVIHLIEESRLLRVQSYNNYRRRFGLKPVQTFEEITGDLRVASILKELYLDVEAVELMIGLVMENKGNGVLPPTMTTIAGAWLVRGLMSHPINSNDWWKPSTFGGKIGMDIVKSASLKKLICLNIKSKCQDVYVSFKVPQP